MWAFTHTSPILASVYTLSDSRFVAKIEKKGRESTLPYEYKAYRRLSSLPYVPNHYFFGNEHGYYCLVLENAKSNMEEYFQIKKEILPTLDSGGLAATVAVEMVSPFAAAALTISG